MKERRENMTKIEGNEGNLMKKMEIKKEKVRIEGKERKIMKEMNEGKENK